MTTHVYSLVKLECTTNYSWRLTAVVSKFLFVFLTKKLPSLHDSRFVFVVLVGDVNHMHVFKPC